MELIFFTVMKEVLTLQFSFAVVVLLLYYYSRSSIKKGVIMIAIQF